MPTRLDWPNRIKKWRPPVSIEVGNKFWIFPPLKTPELHLFLPQGKTTNDGTKRKWTRKGLHSDPQQNHKSTQVALGVERRERKGEKETPQARLRRIQCFSPHSLFYQSEPHHDPFVTPFHHSSKPSAKPRIPMGVSTSTYEWTVWWTVE